MDLFAVRREGPGIQVDEGRTMLYAMSPVEGANQKNNNNGGNMPASIALY